MKKSLIRITAVIAVMSSSAWAADIPTKALPPAGSSYSWSSCYLGGNVGLAWDFVSTERIGQVGIPLPSQYYGSDSGTGFVGGGQIGCDYQVQSWVFGIQGLGDWGRINTSHVIPPFPTFDYNTTINNFATLTGRIGYTAVPAALLYLKGGGAWTPDSITVTVPSAAFLSEFANPTFTGWTIGGGLEWMLSPNVSAFIEYDYLHFGPSAITFTDGPAAVGAPDIINHKQAIDSLLVGFNYRMNWFGFVR